MDAFRSKLMWLSSTLLEFQQHCFRALWGKDSGEGTSTRDLTPFCDKSRIDDGLNGDAPQIFVI